MTHSGEPTDGSAHLDGAAAADSPTALLRPDDLVAALASWLHEVHDGQASASDDRRTVDHRVAVALAADRVAAGLVDTESLDPAYRSAGPERLLEMAVDLASRVEPALPVPLAGDPATGSQRLADVRIARGRVVRQPSTGDDIVGDPYADLVGLALGLAAAIGPGAVPALFDAYGIDRPEPARIELWAALVQLLR